MKEGEGRRGRGGGRGGGREGRGREISRERERRRNRVISYHTGVERNQCWLQASATTRLSQEDLRDHDKMLASS